MRLFAATLLPSISIVFACGGSASETPFPEEPLPDYVTHKPAPSASARKPALEVPSPGASVGVSGSVGKSVPPNGGSQAEPAPAQPKKSTPAF